jgi:hypothetical protein
MKLKKGSKEAKEYMAKIRAKKGTTKKVVAKKTIAKKVGAVTKSKNVVNDLSNQSVHILFLNKNKGFQKDKKVFKNYNDAVKWGKKNLDNFNLDMIKFGIGSALKLNKKEYRLGMPPKTTSDNASGYHKDTKSHNVNIRVVSGFENIIDTDKTLSYIQIMTNTINRIEDKLNDYQKRPTYIKDKFDVAEWNKEKRILKYQLAFSKRNLRELKKQYASQKQMLKKLQ